MPVYEVETDQGTFELDVDQEIPDTLQGWAILQRLIAQQLTDQAFDRRNFPVQTAAGDVGRGVVGGVLDATQQVLDPRVKYRHWAGTCYRSRSETKFMKLSSTKVTTPRTSSAPPPLKLILVSSR